MDGVQPPSRRRRVDDQNEGYAILPEPVAQRQRARAYAGAGAFRAARAARPAAQPEQHAPAADNGSPPPQPQPNAMPAFHPQFGNANLRRISISPHNPM